MPKGQCHCGAVHYDMPAETKHQAICHCSDCRRHAGAPFVSWALPGTRQHEHPPVEGAERYFAQIDLEAEFEPMVGAKKGFAAPGLRDQDRLIRDVLARSGHAHTKFRGFRCSLNYPVPLLDMFVWLRH